MFTYGLLIYRLFGARSEASFVRSWGLGLAAENVAQLQEIVENTLKTLAVVVFLDLVVIGVRRRRWRPLFCPLCATLL